MGHSVHHYVKIWAILCCLLVVSVIGPLVGDVIRESNATLALWVTLITAFGIAFYKAYLVAKHFMHLDVEKPIVWYFLITALAFMVLFFAGVAPDVMNHEGSNWVNHAAKAEVARGMAAGSGHHGDDHGAHGGEHGADAHGTDDGHGHGKDDAHGKDDGHGHGADAHGKDDGHGHGKDDAHGKDDGHGHAKEAEGH